MISKFISGKTAVFIDSSNIYFAQKSLNWRIDFKKLLEYFKSQVDLTSAYFYTAYDSSSRKQRKFLDFLEMIGFIVSTKKVKFIKDNSFKEGGFHKGNLDVELTIDAVYNAESYVNAVIVSGDSDFEALIKFLKAQRKRCLVISTKGHVSIELLRQAKFIDIKKLQVFIKLKPLIIDRSNRYNAKFTFENL